MTERSRSRFRRQYESPKAGEERSDQRRDRDRLLYSPYLRRLSGITQIISPYGYHPTHNRLTHTLEVAQIARSIAEGLLANSSTDLETVELFGGLDPDIVEAAALAHDLGHPPFGHIAEQELNDLIENELGHPHGYEGNAQTFRILTKLDVRSEGSSGLNLTRATLSAASKYPWFREASEARSSKWGAYLSEEDDFNWSRGHLSHERRHAKTLEADIMDWADDIAYAVHDLEDFYRAGLVPLERLVSESNERRRFFEDAGIDDRDAAESALIRILEFIPIETAFDGTHKARARLKQLSSSLVDSYIGATVVADPSENIACLTVRGDATFEVDLLKRVTRYYVINSDAVRSQRYGQRSVIRRLFRELLDDTQSRSHGSQLLPRFYWELIDDDNSNENVVRCVADFISGLTEPQVVAFHNRITGTSLGTDLDQVIF